VGTSLNTSERIGTASADQPVFFPESDPKFFGIVSEPEGTVNDTAVVLLSGTYGGTTTLGRNRIWLRMARSLADRGHRVLRFDYAGIGDSVGDAVCYELEKPAIDELKAGMALLADRGAQQFIVVGTCYGSRTALMGAAGDPRVKGVHLLVPPIGSGNKGTGGAEHLAEYHGSASLIKKAFSKRILRKLIHNKRAREAARKVVTLKAKSIVSSESESEKEVKDPSPDFFRPLRQLLEDGVPIHMLFGEADFFWTEFEEARQGKLGQLLESHSEQVEIETIPGIVRGFLSTRVQDACIDSVVSWVQTHSR
jgi:pimeloyl-ACP methyl ester carboxylesterase